MFGLGGEDEMGRMLCMIWCVWDDVRCLGQCREGGMHD